MSFLACYKYNGHGVYIRGYMYIVSDGGYSIVWSHSYRTTESNDPIFAHVLIGRWKSELYQCA